MTTKGLDWQAVFFDFDGVIVDSANIKTNAFAKMFRNYGSRVEQEVVAYHLKHMGVSRFDKFQYYYENLLMMPVSEEKLQELAAEFSRAVLSEVLVAPYIPGALETLETLKAANIPSFIVSGTPDDEMNLIIKSKGLSNYFEEVHGSPRKKSEIVAEILGRKGFIPSECLFIGDAMTDYAAARERGVCFIGVLTDDSPSPFPAGTWVSSSVTVSGRASKRC